MQQPPGFIDQDKLDYVCKLHYWFKQETREWFNKFNEYPLEFGFCYSKSDPSLFVYLRTWNIIILRLYIDDIILTENDKNLIQDMLNSLSTVFRMKDMGCQHYFLGFMLLIILMDCFLIKLSMQRIFFKLQECQIVVLFQLLLHYSSIEFKVKTNFSLNLLTSAAWLVNFNISLLRK